MAAHLLCKQGVEGSSPFASTPKGPGQRHDPLTWPFVVGPGGGARAIASPLSLSQPCMRRWEALDRIGLGVLVQVKGYDRLSVRETIILGAKVTIRSHRACRPWV
jgi:hypothetical protein